MLLVYMQKTWKEKLNLKMLNRTHFVARHALLVDRYRRNETRKKLRHRQSLVTH